jgi:hypothetical protein
LDFSRLGRGEALAGMAGLALLVFMFLPWFSLEIDAPASSLPDLTQGVEPPGIVVEHPAVTDEVDAWDGLDDLDGFLIALAGLVGMGLALLAAAGRRINLGDLPRGSVTAALGSLAVALILWRMLSGPGDLEYGIFLGLLAAIGVAAGAIISLQEAGVALLVSTTGSRAGGRRSSSRKSSGSSSGRKSSGSSSGRKSPGRKSSGSSARKSPGRKSSGSSSARKSPGSSPRRGKSGGGGRRRKGS